MHNCVKYGDLIVPGYWVYPYNYKIMNCDRKSIKPGDTFMISLYDTWECYKKFCKEKKIEYFTVDSYPGKFGYYCDINTYNKIRRVLCIFAYAKYVITKITAWHIYAKLIYKTCEYGFANHKRNAMIGHNMIKNYEIKLTKYTFVLKARQNKHGSEVGKNFLYETCTEKVFLPRYSDCEPIRFRIDPVILHPKTEWLYYGKKYWNNGMSKKGLFFGSFRRAYDVQCTEYENESDDSLIFNDIRAKNRYYECCTYERRKPHRKSWKECTKKRKQWM